MTDGADTDQQEVRVSVSAHQKAQWREHADELGMSQSEFVRTMTQAGRRGVTDAEPTGSEDETPGVDGLENRVFDVLDEDYCSWDELVESLTEDIEGRLETTLQRLQRENRVQYSGRHGGYSLTNADDD
jgi:DNA-binding transcriptional MocR family regulator